MKAKPFPYWNDSREVLPENCLSPKIVIVQSGNHKLSGMGILKEDGQWHCVAQKEKICSPHVLWMNLPHPPLYVDKSNNRHRFPVWNAEPYVSPEDDEIVIACYEMGFQDLFDDFPELKARVTTLGVFNKKQKYYKLVLPIEICKKKKEKGITVIFWMELPSPNWQIDGG